jgi:hypothetical protein
VRLVSGVLVALALLTGCYQQPPISPQRPLRCTSSTEKDQCPKGYVCVADRVCAPTSCSKNEDCPDGLTCSSRGCVPPPDGGTADGAEIQIPNTRDGGLFSSPDRGAIGTDVVSVPPDAPSSPEDGPVQILDLGGQD